MNYDYSKYRACDCSECLRFTRSEWRDVAKCILVVAALVAVTIIGLVMVG